MKGSKLVSDYLTDRKRSMFEKKSKLVVTDSEGAILWLVGERTDNRFRIDDNSKEALILSFERQ
jgi:tRNA(Ile)-lysidine synthase